MTGVLQFYDIRRGFVRVASRSDREQHQDLGAFADIAPDVERSAMALDDVLDDRQAEPGAAGFAAARGVGPVEALGHPAQMLARNSRSVVAHRDAHESTLANRRDPDRALAALAAVA